MWSDRPGPWMMQLEQTVEENLVNAAFSENLHRTSQTFTIMSDNTWTFDSIMCNSLLCHELRRRLDPKVFERVSRDPLLVSDLTSSRITQILDESYFNSVSDDCEEFGGWS